jgi:hypothetical protein
MSAGDHADCIRALDLHKDRIRRLQEELCECQQRDLFQADLHDEACPVYLIASDRCLARDLDRATDTIGWCTRTRGHDGPHYFSRAQVDI